MQLFIWAGLLFSSSPCSWTPTSHMNEGPEPGSPPVSTLAYCTPNKLTGLHQRAPAASRFCSKNKTKLEAKIWAALFANGSALMITEPKDTSGFKLQNKPWIQMNTLAEVMQQTVCRRSFYCGGFTGNGHKRAGKPPAPARPGPASASSGLSQDEPGGAGEEGANQQTHQRVLVISQTPKRNLHP